MKKYGVVPGVLCLLAASAAGCTGDAQDAATEPPTNADQQEQLVAPIGAALPVAAAAAPLAGAIAPIGNIMVWPAGPIVLNGLAATMPLGIWSSQPIGLFAANLAGVSNLSLSLGTLSTAGAFTAINGFAGVPISAGFLGGIQAGLATPFFGLGAGFGAGFGAGAVGVGSVASGLAAAPGLLAATSPIGLGFTPAITNSALMFGAFPALTGTAPFIVNIGFNWPATLATGGLSIFTASAASTAAFSSAAVSTTAANTLAFQSTVFPLNFIAGTGGIAPMLVW